MSDQRSDGGGWIYSAILLLLALVVVIGYGKYKYSEAKATAKAKANLSNCLAFESEEDEDGKWVTTPAGSYRRDGDGRCVVGTPPPPPPPQSTTEALVLEHECETPCSAIIAWRFKIVWGDNPLRITYPGGQVVDRRGQDRDFQAPSSMMSGETKFESLDPDHPHFRVQVYRVVIIR
jgi:hypothetical protein